MGCQDYGKDPSPEEIKVRAAEIRRGWTVKTELDRRMSTLPEFLVRIFRQEMKEEHYR